MLSLIIKKGLELYEKIVAYSYRSELTGLAVAALMDL